MVTEAVYPDAPLRRLITFSVMASALMVALDMTIVNVALPHIAGSTSASSDEITWVLTSYIVASAIMTPLSGWLADRYGRRIVMLVSVVGFTLSSVACGVSMTLDELVFFRILQGVTGAALMPISQSILFSINPPEKHGQAMAIFGMGAIVGPIIGPVLGGWLTDNFSWRWCFLINIPVGILAFLGLMISLSRQTSPDVKRFDIFGFSMTALAIGAFQLMLDRGQQQDWFSSTEICIEAALAAFFLYCLIAHTLTTRDGFINPVLFKDRNFSLASFFGFFIGISMFSVTALLPLILEQLLGYPVVTTGLTMMWRGAGAMLAMFTAGPAMKRFAPRLLVAFGFVVTGSGSVIMSGFSLGMDNHLVIIGGLLSGYGSAFAFVPLTTIAFGTIDPKYRNQGSAIFTLLRSIGSAAGISIVSVVNYQNSVAAHARLVEGVRPDNPVLAFRYPDFDFSPHAVAVMNGQITRQAAMLSYTETFWMLGFGMIVVVPLALFLKKTRAAAKAEPVHFD